MNWKLSLLLTLIATPGVIAISWLALPLMIDLSMIPVPLQTLQVITALQSLLLVALAATAGTFFSNKLGLRCPGMSAIVNRSGFVAAMRPQLLPGIVGGACGAAIVIGFYALSPEALSPIQHRQGIPLLARILYGGITEEILIRWGLMSLLAWCGWRLFQRGKAEVSTTVIWFAIGLSAMLFGLSHVPSALAITGALPVHAIVYITAGNALFGLIAGHLFWRYGLEAAIIAHILAHLLAFILHG